MLYYKLAIFKIMKMPLKTRALYLRNFVFGVEDSLVSTVGLLSGVAAAGINKSTILISGIVLIFVEAFSMGVGSFLAEDAAADFASRKDTPDKEQAAGGFIMFISYFVAGFVPLAPYLIWPVQTAFWLAIIFSLLALFILGFFGGTLSGAGSLKHGLKMFFIGGLAIVLGIVVGKIAALV
jgi:VIT1/CCC1 family predicted Fe2+/Mn2+ transporter